MSLYVYNAAMVVAERAIGLVRMLSALFARKGKGKLVKFAEGQHNILDKIEREMAADARRPVLWVHASSLGEYGVVRPVIERMREERGYRVVLTFFSPTGYEALTSRRHNEDHVFYLPFDTRGNARRFLDSVKPEKALFVISEYWTNYLAELNERNIPVYLISAIISSDSLFMKWYGSLLRKPLAAFRHFMVLNEESADNLRKMGYDNVSVTGDPLFDNAVVLASAPWDNAIVERFAVGDTYIAGSVSDANDLRMVCALANRHSDVRFIIVPHEIDNACLRRVRKGLHGRSLLYSECDERTDFADVQSLIIDYVGDLPYLYRYAKWAYVGGGFTPYLHSVIEPVVYGLPVAFGPKTRRKVPPCEMVRLGIGTIVRSAEELDEWFGRLRNNRSELERIRRAAIAYTAANSGATSQIVKRLTE